MKKYYILLVTLVVLFTTVSVGAASLYYQQSGSGVNVASTTAVFVIGGTATTTTTKTIISDGYESVSYFVALASSSTPPTLCWKNQYSNNGTDFYTGLLNYASTTVFASGEKNECWTYSTTTAGTNILSYGSDGKTIYLGRKITVPSLDSVYTRTIFTIDPAVNVRIDIRDVRKNEIVLTK